MVDSSLWLTNRFDQLGNLVEQAVLDNPGDSGSISIYDDHNTWLEKISYEGNTSEARTAFIYHRNGLISHTISFDSLGLITSHVDYQYWNDEQNISLKKRGPLDSLQYSIFYTHEPGSGFKREIEVVQTDAHGSLRTKVQNQYVEDR